MLQNVFDGTRYPSVFHGTRFPKRGHQHEKQINRNGISRHDCFHGGCRTQQSRSSLAWWLVDPRSCRWVLLWERSSPQDPTITVMDHITPVMDHITLTIMVPTITVVVLTIMEVARTIMVGEVTITTDPTDIGQNTN